MLSSLQICVITLCAFFFLAFFFFFLSHFPFTISIRTSVCFIVSFSCRYYAVSSVSFATCSAYRMYIWYVRTLSFFFFFVWGDTIWFSYCKVIVYFIIFSFFSFSSWGNLTSRSLSLIPLYITYHRSLSCDHGLDCGNKHKRRRASTQQEQHSFVLLMLILIYYVCMCV